MPFKVHLLIIACIIIAVLLSWQFMPKTPAHTAETRNAKILTISITHASWGLNCPSVAINSDASRHDAFMNKPVTNTKLHEDNVLGPVGILCNGTTKCDVTPDETTLGTDPAPECTSKSLEIEYRCFSYDRPWNVKTTTAAVSLHCDQTPK